MPSDRSSAPVTRPDETTRPFQPLADYTVPRGPAVHVLQRLWRRARRVVHVDERRVVEDERLGHASQAAIGHATAVPDCRPLARELDRTLGDWAVATPDTGFAEGERQTDASRLVVVPPGNVHDLLETWARRNGHALLEPPPRDALGAAGVFELDGAGVLVVPRLEQWFLRHRHGLDRVRELLAALSSDERRCVIGCNSWAWSFLQRAVGADLLLPEPLTFVPFDAERLRAWFVELTERGDTPDTTFREASSGDDIFARDDDGELVSDYLRGIAVRSRGIPWVAWSLWQRSLRTMRVDEKGRAEEVPASDGTASSGSARDDTGGGDDVLWLVRPDELVLPRGHERTARLVLHALLLHGALAADELALVLPLVGESNIVPALWRAGFVERVGRRFRCTSVAYPVIVESLSTAGFTMPRI